MKNKDTNTGYQNIVRVGDQRSETLKNKSELSFLFETQLHYFHTGYFQVPPEKKSPPPKGPIPIQKSDLICASYINLQNKWLNHLPHHRARNAEGKGRGGGGGLEQTKINI